MGPPAARRRLRVRAGGVSVDRDGSDDRVGIRREVVEPVGPAPLGHDDDEPARDVDRRDPDPPSIDRDLCVSRRGGRADVAQEEPVVALLSQLDGGAEVELEPGTTGDRDRPRWSETVGQPIVSQRMKAPGSACAAVQGRVPS
jgi:hypothetical protein